MISVDLHLHTCHSFDCATPLDEVVHASQRSGLDCVAVTDHNTIEGALRLRESTDLRIIVGQEVGTSDGELIGLFLSEPVPRGLTAIETIARIKEQGGLVCIPHPLGRRRFHANSKVGSIENGQVTLSRAVRRANRLLTDDVLTRVDMLETINSRTPFKGTWRAISRLADLYGLPVTAGSDSHTAREIGRARVVMPDFTDAASFLAAIRDARPSGETSSLFIHFASMYARLSRRLC